MSVPARLRFLATWLFFIGASLAAELLLAVPAYFKFRAVPWEQVFRSEALQHEALRIFLALGILLPAGGILLCVGVGYELRRLRQRLTDEDAVRPAPRDGSGPASH